MSTYIKIVTSSTGDVKSIEDLGEQTEVRKNWDGYFGILLQGDFAPCGRFPDRVVTRKDMLSIFPANRKCIESEEEWLLLCHVSATPEDVLRELELNMESEETEKEPTSTA